MPAEIFLKFRNERGAEQTVSVNKSPFFIGRLPECELPINRTSLSRKHAKIERFADVAVISDCGSSNGTTLNGATLTEPIALKNGDEIELGGDVIVNVEIRQDQSFADNDDYYGSSKSASGSSGKSNVSASSGSILLNPYFIAPFGGVIVLATIAGMIAFFTIKPQPREKDENDDANEAKPIVTRKSSNDKTPSISPTPVVISTATPSTSPTASTVNSASPTPSLDVSTPVPANGLDKVEINAYKFLRRVSNDNRPALTTPQLSDISTRIKSIQNSGALRENLRTAKRNFSAMQSASEGQGLKAMLVVAAALARMGERRGDVTSDANGAIPALKNCADVLGIDTANDSLLVIAATDGNQPEALKNKLGKLAKQFNAVEVRNVFFLRQHNELPPDTYDLVLRVLAVGTIAQNPKDFNIDADPL